MRVRFRSEEGVGDMGLKAPGIITFMLSVILTVIVFVASVIQLRAFRDRDGDAA